MSKMIETKFIWNEAIALKSSELFYKYEFRHSYRRYVGWVFIAMAQFGVVGALKHDAYGMLIVSSFLLFYWYVVRWQLRKRFALNSYKRSPLAGKEIETRFDDTGLLSNEQLVAWADVDKVVEYENDFLFYTKDQANFFPKEAFVSSEDRSSLRTLIQSVGVRYEKEQ